MNRLTASRFVPIQWLGTADIPACAGAVLKTWIINGAASYSEAPDGNSVLVTWGEAGAGSVSLEVRQVGSCEFITESRCIEIVSRPESSFKSFPEASSGDTLEVCKGQTVEFANTSPDAEQVEWFFQTTGPMPPMMHYPIYSTFPDGIP
ncbi:MAG: hypothetical protein R2792_17630 [Saprospiraceae bacterium]